MPLFRMMVPSNRVLGISRVGLRRQFTIDRPDHAWATDITDIRTYEGWRYPTDVMDLSSRRIIGWWMKPTLAKEIVLDA